MNKHLSVNMQDNNRLRVIYILCACAVDVNRHMDTERIQKADEQHYTMSLLTNQIMRGHETLRYENVSMLREHRTRLLLRVTCSPLDLLFFMASRSCCCCRCLSAAAASRVSWDARSATSRPAPPSPASTCSSCLTTTQCCCPSSVSFSNEQLRKTSEAAPWFSLSTF